MMIGFIGRMGQGKTLSMTVLGCYLAHKTGSNIVSRHHINIAGASQIKEVKDIWATGRTVLMWDEIWIDVDSRDYKNNIDLSRFAMFTRKKEIIMMYSAQHFSQVEMRIRNATDLLISCEKIIRRDRRTGKKRKSHRLTIIDGHTQKIYKTLTISHPEKFYRLYDTNEIIEPLKGGKVREQYKPPPEDKRPAWEKHRDEVRAQYKKPEHAAATH